MITYCDDEGNDLDIDVKDFVWGLSTYETEELLEELVSQMKTSALSNVLKKNSIPREQLVINTEEMPSTSTKNTLENDVEKPEMIVANFIKNRKVNDHDELLVTAAIPKWEGSKSVEELTKLPYRMELNIKVEGKVKYSELYVELDNPKCLVKVPVNEWVKIGCAKKVAFITISCADNKTKPFKVMSGKRIIVKVGGVGISG